MRNTLFRSFIEETVKKTNDMIQNGIEPLALAMALRSMADQCDRLATELEAKEKEAKESEEENVEQDV